MEGIKQALSDDPKYGSVEFSVLLLCHKAGEEGRERTRRLFTTLNRYAVPVSKYDKIALDEDDALAIVTRRLLNDHPFLSGARTAYSKSAAISTADKTSLTTLPVVYSTAVTIIKGRSIGGETWTSKRIPYPRPTDDQISDLLAEASEYWTGIGEWASEFKEAAQLDNEDRSKIQHAEP